MRVKFTQHVDVDIETIPAGARGAVGIRFPRSLPKFVPGSQKPDANGVITVSTVKMNSTTSKKYFFRSGWAAELPDDLAQQYIDAGQAVQVASVIRMDADDFTQFNGLYNADHEAMFLAGVITGYQKGSSPERPLFERGPNWDKWQAAIEPPEIEEESDL